MNDDTMEALLRQQLDGPVPDDGFSDQVLQQLPPRRGRVNWPLWAGLLSGVATCWLSLVVCVPQLDWLDWTDGKLSASAIALLAVVGGVSILACWWSAVEADR